MTMTPEEKLAMARECAKLKELLAEASPLPWAFDMEGNDGAYGSGPNAESGFSSAMILGPDGLSLFDALNSTAIVVHEDGPDEYGAVCAWDETSRANAALIVEAVNALPSLLLAIDRMQERVRAETERCEGIVAARMKTLAALEGSFASQRFMEAEMIIAAIRETTHAEG